MQRKRGRHRPEDVPNVELRSAPAAQRAPSGWRQNYNIQNSSNCDCMQGVRHVGFVQLNGQTL